MGLPYPLHTTVTDVTDFVTVIAGVAFLGQIISQAVSRQLYTEANQLLFDAFSDIDTKYFTQRYVNFLEDLLYGNKTTNGTMTNTTAVNRTGI